MIEVEVQAELPIETAPLVERLQATAERLGIGEATMGLMVVGPERMRALNAEHRGIDKPTDVLSFPLDGRDEVPAGVPRALGDVVLCPEVVGESWRAPLVHGLLHLLGYDHGAEMEAREAAHAT